MKEIKRLGLDDMFFSSEAELEPVCVSGLNNEKATLIFNKDFNNETISNLIYRIDNVRQSGSYAKLDIYFSSDGGNIDSMFMLADYINSIEDDFEIVIKVNGGVCSAGFYILFLLENTQVLFGESSWGMIHLGTTWLDARGLLDPRKDNYSHNKFHKSEMDRLNKKFKDLIEQLKLTPKEKKYIYNGNDLYLCKSRLEEIYNDYFMKKDYNHPKMIETYLDIKTQAESLNTHLESLKKGFIKYGTKSTLEEIGLKR